MNLLITGASGFIGRAVVAEAARRGHTISASPSEAQGIVHLAPVVEGMEQMIAAAPDARFVLISSLAVYDFAALAENSLLDERSPLAPAGPYAETKLAQEEVARRRAANLKIPRPVIHTLLWRTLERSGGLGLGSLHDLFNPRLLAARCKPLRYN
jgi:nucleoside-diphosphate-sugar epimerase